MGDNETKVDPYLVYDLELREKLHRAIRMAENPGWCRYSEGCVIGQLAKEEGVSEEQLAEWDRMRNLDIAHLYGTLPKDHKLRQYSMDVLVAIQVIWDDEDDLEEESMFDDVEEERREMMHDRVNDFISVVAR